MTVAHLHHRRRAATQGVPPGAGCQRSARLPDGGCWPASTRTGSRRSSSRIPASRPVLGPFATGDLPRYHSGPWADNQHASIAGRGNGQDHSARRADRLKDCLSHVKHPLSSGSRRESAIATSVQWKQVWFSFAPSWLVLPSVPNLIFRVRRRRIAKSLGSMLWEQRPGSQRPGSRLLQTAEAPRASARTQLGTGCDYNPVEKSLVKCRVDPTA